MNEDVQNPETEKAPTLSPFAQDKTYGEQKYDFIFGTLINFWLNLGVSALFTYWISHSQNVLKNPFTKKEITNFKGDVLGSPSQVQGKIAEGIHDWGIMKVFDDTVHESGQASNRQKYATNAAGVMTLVTGGHFVLIPSVWLGAKIKAPLVEWFDRRHYGAEAMEAPDIKARHAALAIEERPTFFGAVIGRIGSVVATQVTSYTIGNPSNIITWLGGKLNSSGLKKFTGIDHISGVIGDKAGEAITELMPSTSQNFDAHLVKNNNSWSNQQVEKNASLPSQTYHGAFKHISKYTAQDVLYTAVTSATIMPIINALKHYIPGMTYTPKAKPGVDVALAKQITLRPAPLRSEDNFSQTPTPIFAAPATPSVQISHAEPHSTLTPPPERAVANGG